MQENSVTLPEPKFVSKQVLNPKTNIKKKILIYTVVASVSVVIVIFGLSVILKDNSAQDSYASVVENVSLMNDLSELKSYKGKALGLYNNNSNSPSINQKVLAQRQLQLIKPLDGNGNPATQGKIGFVYIGDPYTQGEFASFNELIKDNNLVNQKLVLVDGADIKIDTTYWEKSQFAWENLKKSVDSKYITEKQVQIVWINLSNTASSSELDSDIQNFADILQKITESALIKFPNTRIVYLSSPRYMGYSTESQFKEPDAYETSFAVRELISRQEKGELNFRENITSLESDTVLLWGPYVWNNSTAGSSAFSISKDDLMSDGLIFTAAGRQKYVLNLFTYWSENEFTKSWFGS
jgi:hypothetical protein